MNLDFTLHCPLASMFRTLSFKSARAETRQWQTSSRLSRSRLAVTRAYSVPTESPPATNRRHKVVVVGAGFGGMSAVHALRGAPVDITCVDRFNYHLFQPLLYQVGTCALDASDIAWPIRGLVSGRQDVTTLMGEVKNVDKNNRVVQLDHGQQLSYDTLILATGARDAFFGHDEWADIAPGLKSLKDATTVRRRILLGFEMAEREEDPEARKAFMTYAIVGAGPTGVELAGAVSQMARNTLPNEYRNIDTREARVVLIEAGPRVLGTFKEDLSEYARQALEELGVEVKLNSPVSELTHQYVKAGDETIPCYTIFWAAGVQASPAHEWLSAPVERGGKIKVNSDLSVPGHPEIFAIGDTASAKTPNGGQVPGVAPAAKQMGHYVGKLVRDRVNGINNSKPFRYVDNGSLATIGKNKAVVDFGFIRMKGWAAWWLWGIAHIYFLIGVRSRLMVALNWLYNFTFNARESRLITQDPRQDIRDGKPKLLSPEKDTSP